MGMNFREDRLEICMVEIPSNNRKDELSFLTAVLLVSTPIIVEVNTHSAASDFSSSSKGSVHLMTR